MDTLQVKNKFDSDYSYMNKYAAIMDVAHKARILKNSSSVHIRESECLDWAVTGEVPEKVKVYTRKRRNPSTEFVISYVDEFLSNVSDEGIRSSVKASVKASREAKKTVYVYIDVEDSDGKHSRVRIITNMILKKLTEVM